MYVYCRFHHAIEEKWQNMHAKIKTESVLVANVECTFSQQEF